MNILLLEKGCVDCSAVKVCLDFDKIQDSTYLGTNGQKILTFFSMTSEASDVFAESLGMSKVTPILRLSDGQEIVKVDEIIYKIREFGYGK